VTGEGDTAPVPLPDPVKELEARLGLGLADRVTALAALTHKSYANEHRDEGAGDNERLEFLGDAVVDLLVSHRLMDRFPDAREGDLSKMRAGVVDEAGLAAMARALGLGDLLRLGRGEEMTGGREKASLLADAMEAVIAAVYLEHGIGPALGLVDRFLEESFARAVAGTLDRDWKTQLQELVQGRLRATPRYRVAGERGPDHAKVFEVELEVAGEVLGRGSGRSKKDAEQVAARIALEELPAREAALAARLAERAAPSVAASRASAQGAPVAPDAEAAGPEKRRRPGRPRARPAARARGGARGRTAGRAAPTGKRAKSKKKVAARRRRR
jgi:ribonuclease III